MEYIQQVVLITSQYNFLRLYCIFTKTYKDVIRVFTPYMFETGICLSWWA